MNIQDHYQRTKRHLSADKSQPDRALSLIKEDFTDNLQSLVEGYQFWKQEKKVSKNSQYTELNLSIYDRMCHLHKVVRKLGHQGAGYWRSVHTCYFHEALMKTTC